MESPLKLVTRLLRALLVAVLVLCLWNTVQARADNIEQLMVPSAAMGRDVPVTFAGGGPHAVLLLDSFNAAPDVSHWIPLLVRLKPLLTRASRWSRRQAVRGACTPTGRWIAASNGRLSCPRKGLVHG